MARHVGGVVVGKESASQARARRRLSRQLARKVKVEARAASRAKRLAARQEWQAGAVGKLGPEGGAGLRRLWPTRIPYIQTTTRIARVAYPFLAEAGLGNQGPLIGTDLLSGSGFTYDPWLLYQRGVLTNPNITVAGVIGTGKSALCKALATRSFAFGRNTYIPGDVKGEWSPVARAFGGAVIRLGRGLKARLNPLDEGTRPALAADGSPLDNNDWARLVRASRLALLKALVERALGRSLRAEEDTALALALDEVVARHSTPLIGQVMEELLEPSTTSLPLGVRDRSQLAQMGWQAGHGLGRMVSGDLAGLFDGPSTVAFDPKAPMVSVDLSAFEQDNAALPMLMACTAAWMESSLRDPTANKRYVVYDEAHRLMADPALLHRMKEQWKLARAWGISNVLVLHRFSDLEAVGDEGSETRGLAKGLVTDTSTRIVFGQPADQLDVVRSWLGLSSEVVDQLPGMVNRRGLAVWQINSRPFFVQDYLTRSEQDLFDTDGRMA